MAFVARRNTEGNLVDCQVISGGLRSSSMSMSDVSDDDTDAGTVHGYSNRSYVSPTVRYVSTKEDEDSSYTYDGTNEQYESGEENAIVEDQEAGEDYLSDGNSDEEIDNDKQFYKSVQDIEEKTIITPARYIAGGGDADRELHECSTLDALSLSSIDEVTVCSPSDSLKMQQDDNMSLGSYDVNTVCQSENNQADDDDDAISMSSYDVATVCQPSVEAKLQLNDTISIGSINSTVCPPVEADNRSIAPDNISTHTFDCKSQITSRTYNVKSTTVRRDDCSSASTCSWTDMYGGALKQSESRSNIVPSLSLNLSTTSSSSGSSTFFRNLDDKKERHGQAAYQEWVKRKERQKLDNIKNAKVQQEKKDAETALRQRLAKERYQEWVRQKELQQKKASTSSIKSTTSSNSYKSNSSGFGGVAQARLHRKETAEQTLKRLEDWDRVKKQQQQRERDRLRQQELSRARLEQQRKQKSEGAWQNWMKTVGKRAKPVPLNQGFDTLRGTVSNIYVNPNQWVSNIDTHDTRGN